MRGARVSKHGVFSPLVYGARAALGDQELTRLRGEVIKAHSAVIAAFVETHASDFGQIALERLFLAADADGNGTLDKHEVRRALESLGFNWMSDAKVEGLVSKADVDGNEVIDFEEFATAAPKVLRQNLVKLAKQNGHDLGFLV